MRIFLGSLLLLFVVFAHAQEKFYTEPLKIPLLISGSFAELRSNHFHSGIDIKTQGKTGLEVYSTAQGYISRIVVSPTGFGNALYIDHPNGTTSVYGHLSKFRNDIANYIKSIQYENESFKVDIPLPRSKFNIEKGEIIGYSGDSGSSGGPHLHFEIRNTQTQEPVDPFNLNFNVDDNIKPIFEGLRIFPLDQSSHVNFSENSQYFSVMLRNSSYHIENNQVIPVYGKIGFAVRAIDYIDGTWNKCGINTLKLLIDGNEYFSLHLDRFSYDDTKYINSLIEYKTLIENNTRYYKTWKDPGNYLPVFSENTQIYECLDSLKHEVEIIVSDSHNNSSSLIFIIEGRNSEISRQLTDSAQKFSYQSENSFQNEDIKLSFQKNTFYDDINFKYDVLKEMNTSELIYSEIHKIHDITTPLHKPVKLSVRANSFNSTFTDKLLLVSIDEKTGDFSSAGGNFQDGWVTTNINTFGLYAIAMDTIPPEITPLSIRNNESLTEENRIRFRINDSLSGIKSYKGTIDSKWALFEYDGKNNMITYYFDPEKINYNTQHNLFLTVTDNKNNITTYQAVFYK